MTARTSATRYARALLDVALAEADPQAVEQQLAGVVDLFRGHADLWKVMTNPAVPVTRKQGIVSAMLPKLELSPVLDKLLKMMTGRDRIGLLPDLLEAYRSRLMDHQKVVQAQVTSAVPLTPDRVQKLEASLGALTGRKVLMKTATDPGMMGGIITRIGSTVYDGSVRRQLEKMRERIGQSA
ncbi:MAG: ATP synthase F1 subunit delta [Acidobacteria bacterium]|nr:ATP synthase F1 subunit delta [Acidobacteriota bacterium]